MMTLKDLKKTVNRNRNLILGIAGATAIAAAATAVVYVTVKILTAPVPSITIPKMLNDAESVDLSSIEQIAKLHEMIDGSAAIDVISLSEGAILFLEK